MRDTTLTRVREWAAKPVPVPAPSIQADVRGAQATASAEDEGVRIFQERRAEVGAMVREGEDDFTLLMLLQIMSDRDHDKDHTLAGNIETMNAMLSQLAETETSRALSSTQNEAER
jgi:hypothetical protein